MTRRSGSCGHHPRGYFLSSFALSLRFLRPRAQAALSSRSRCAHSRSSVRLGEISMDNNRTCSYPLPLERRRTLPHIVYHNMWPNYQLAFLYVVQ